MKILLELHDMPLGGVVRPILSRTPQALKSFITKHRNDILYVFSLQGTVNAISSYFITLGVIVYISIQYI